MTNHWVDIKNADLVLIMGGNAAEAHPCGFKWVTEAKAHNKARLIVVDPRFTRSASVADVYAPIRAGTDIAFLGGVINYLLTNDKIQREYVTSYTDCILHREGGVRVQRRHLLRLRRGESQLRQVELGLRARRGRIRTHGPDAAHPRCVYNLMKQHYSRYTPEMVERVCGTPKDRFLQICEMIGSTATPTRAMTIMYALGWTQHSVGAQMIRCGAMVQLLLGNIGVSGGGMNALRGHSNIQGLTDLGLLTDLLPGYMASAERARAGLREVSWRARTFKPLRPNQMSYWQNFPKFFISFMKAWWGDAARADNHWAYDYLPKLDKLYDMLQVYELMHRGQDQRLSRAGLQPARGRAEQGEDDRGAVEAEVPRHHGSARHRDLGVLAQLRRARTTSTPARSRRKCFACRRRASRKKTARSSTRDAGCSGTGKAPSRPVRRAPTSRSWPACSLRLRELYQSEGGAFPDPILNLTWPYANAGQSRRPRNSRRNTRARRSRDLADPKDPTKIVRKAGEQLAGFGELRDDGSTASGCWIFCGSWGPTGNLMARRDNSDPTGIGQTLNWAWSWPANRRILYNRASCDPDGKPFNPQRKLIAWDGKQWTGADVPDFKVDEDPGERHGPVHHECRRRRALLRAHEHGRRPVPRALRAVRDAARLQPAAVGTSRVRRSNPAARVFESDREAFGKAAQFPHVATTYRLTEHFHYWTKHVRLNAITQPEQFVEIGEALAKELGVAAGDRVRVTSNRGHIEAVAVVTKRIRQLNIDGKKVHTVGIPIHWGFTGVAKPGYLANTLTPFVGDGNVQTPEFKAFLVKVEKV